MTMEQTRRKSAAIVQSNYIPWKGYFDLINGVDEFILYDDVQFTRRDWRNRNRIKTKRGVAWLTIPVEVKGKFLQKINETRISDPDWGRRHFETIRANYAKAPYFSEYKAPIEALFRGCNSPFLSEVNRYCLDALCKMLNIQTRITASSDYRLEEGRNERLIGLCKQVGAAHYVSGPSAQSYLDTQAFLAEGITVRFMDYSGYPEYPQLFPPFEHAVSIVDLILNVGPNARQYMKQDLSVGLSQQKPS